MCDRNGAIKNAENELEHKRSKHIEIKFHFVKDENNKGNIKINWVSTKDNVADLMTKPVSKRTMERLIPKLYNT